MFSNGDYVMFDDTGSNTTITVATGGVAPGSVLFANTTAKDYSLSGGPIWGTASLDVSGGGRVKLSSANTYTGGTVVSLGTLILADADALPPGGPLAIGAGGTVVLASGLSAARAGSSAAAAVPEPSTLALLGIGAIGMLGWGWRRRRWSR